MLYIYIQKYLFIKINFKNNIMFILLYIYLLTNKKINYNFTKL